MRTSRRAARQALGSAAPFRRVGCAPLLGRLSVLICCRSLSRREVCADRRHLGAREYANEAPETAREEGGGQISGGSQVQSHAPFPLQLVFSNERTSLVVGFRSSASLDVLRDVCRRRGAGRLAPSSVAPTRIIILRQSARAADTATEHVRAPIEHTLCWPRCPPWARSRLPR